MKRKNGSNPKKDRLKAASKERRKRRQAAKIVLAVKMLKGINSKIVILQDIIKIQEKEIADLKTPAPVDGPAISLPAEVTNVAK